MAQSYPSGTNTYIPSFDASGQLVVAYSRNPKEFALNQYVTLIPVKKTSGYYLRITPEVAARIVNDDLREYNWPDGNDAPTGEWGLEGFEFQQFETHRFAFPYRIGYKANEQADWQILASHAAIYAQKAMTARTVRTLNSALDSANYASGHSDTATNLGGGFWDTGDDGTTNGPRIKKSLNAAAFKINKDTLGVVKPKDLVLVIGPTDADQMARSKEVHQYLKESPFALAQVRGDVPNQNGQWGLPEQLYGYKIVIEDCVRGTQKKGATFAPGYVMSNKALLVARSGQLTAAEGSRNWSTIHLFMYEEMTVESRDDPDNRRIAARIVEDWDVRIVSPVSGYLITNLFS